MREKVFAAIPEGEVIPFIEGWDFVAVLGEGGFGEVRLVYNAASELRAAVKVNNLNWFFRRFLSGLFILFRCQIQM